MWVHAGLYARFLTSSNSHAIDIVPAVVAEDIWIALVVISTSTPLLLADLYALATNGLNLDTHLSLAGSPMYSLNTSARSHPRKGRYDRTNDASQNEESDAHSTRWLQQQSDAGGEETELQLRPEYDRGEVWTTVQALKYDKPVKRNRSHGRKDITFETKSEPAEDMS